MRFCNKGGFKINEFINITHENIADEHICCIIRKNSNLGIDSKKKWLDERLGEGHVFCKLNINGCAFIEYAPLETAWTPIVGDNFYYIYCLWVQGAPKGSGYGKKLMELCIADAKAHGKSGVCMLGAQKQKAWLSDQNFAKKFGFKKADETAGGYELLALSFDGTMPQFAPNAKRENIESQKLTVYYDFQCPYIYQRVEKLKDYCAENSIDADFITVDSLEQAKNLPCAFNNWAVFCNGKFVTVNQIDGKAAEKIIKNS